MLNRLVTLFAGCVGTPLHPLGSLEDRAYVLKAAGIDTLVFDASVFDAHAAKLKELVPALQHLLAFGPTECGEDYLALATTFEPKPLVAPDVLPDDVSSVNFTGGTTGKPKGVMSTHRGNGLYDPDTNDGMGIPRRGMHSDG
jgi:fatty-acyl-CoA synthase